MATQHEMPNAIPEVDEDGFLLQPGTWTRKIAQAFVQGKVTGDLTEEHWKLIDCVRQYYLEFETVPPVRMLVRRTGLPMRRIHELFPEGFAKGVCKVAGIPGHILKATRTLNVAGT
ncbi:TusE/DsrC/DsvC family sulfur relay protein [Chloroflexota bacterium]